jgi:hypothetical protein
LSDDSNNENFCSKEDQYSEKAIHETIIAEEKDNNIVKKFVGIPCKPYIIKLIEMSEASKIELTTIYSDYLNNKTKLRTAQKQVFLVEYNFEQLLPEYEEPKSNVLSQVQIQYYMSGITAGIRDAIDLHKRKLDIQEIYDAKNKQTESNKNIAAKNTAHTVTPSIQTEEVTTQIPDVIMELIKGSGMVEAERDVKGRFHPKGNWKDNTIIEWIVDNSPCEKELSASIYCQYIYTKCQQTTLEKYISSARKKY